MTAATEILTTWETVTCSRCGGTGSYSYCSQYGTTCFKCGGQKQVLTARGKAALAWLSSQRQTRVDALQVGMKIKVDGYKHPQVLREIKASLSSCNGRHYTDLTFDPITLGVFPESLVDVIPATEDERIAQVRAAIAYQNTLTKAGKPRKASITPVTL